MSEIEEAMQFLEEKRKKQKLKELNKKW